MQLWAALLCCAVIALSPARADDTAVCTDAETGAPATGGSGDGDGPASACTWAPQWLRLSPNSRTRHPHGLCWVSTERRLIYFNVAKVASTSLKQLVGSRAAGRARQARCEVDPADGRVTAFRVHLGRGEYGGRETAAGFFAFAFVRDPVPRFLSGFHTVAKRGAAGGAYGDSKRMPFVRVVSDDRAQMAAFFADVMRHGGLWEEHTVPQTYYLSHPESRVPVALDFVGRVEHFERDWREVEHRAGLPPVHGLPRRNEREWSSQVPNTVTLAALGQDEEMLRRVCALYEQDFACLNYTRPAACQRAVEAVGAAAATKRPPPPPVK